MLPAGTKIANESADDRGPGDADLLPAEDHAERPPEPVLFALSGRRLRCLAGGHQVAEHHAANGPLPAELPLRLRRLDRRRQQHPRDPVLQGGCRDHGCELRGREPTPVRQARDGRAGLLRLLQPEDGWIGRVTASTLSLDSYGNVTVANTPNWDASCVLTGVRAAAPARPRALPGRFGRSPNPGDAAVTPDHYLERHGRHSLAVQQPDSPRSRPRSTLVTAPRGSTPTLPDVADRVSYLRGDRTNEINSRGAWDCSAAARRRARRHHGLESRPGSGRRIAVSGQLD